MTTRPHPEGAQYADTVAADLSLLWQAARVSPHLRGAVERVEDALRRERHLADDLAASIASHGPWMDDRCRATLAKWEVARGDGLLGPSNAERLIDGPGPISGDGAP